MTTRGTRTDSPIVSSEVSTSQRTAGSSKGPGNNDA